MSKRLKSKAVNPLLKLKKGVKRLTQNTRLHIRAVGSLEKKRTTLQKILDQLDAQLLKAEKLVARLRR